MSVVSNVFEGSTEHLMESKSPTLKGVVGAKRDQFKSKGLSIRSTSDLNITANSYLQQSSLLTPKLSRSDGCDNSVSLKNNSLKKELSKITDEPLKIKSCEINKKRVLDVSPFKKPFTPEKIIRKASYPEPETIAPYYDLQWEFDNVYDIPLENEFRHLQLKVKDDIDEGFASDPEEIFGPDISISLISPNSFHEEYKNFEIPDVPLISDDEDF